MAPERTISVSLYLWLIFVGSSFSGPFGRVSGGLSNGERIRSFGSNLKPGIVCGGRSVVFLVLEHFQA